MLNANIRRNCQKLYLFTTAREDCRIHAREWNRPELMEASNLAQGEYFAMGRYGALTRHKLF